MIDITLWNNNLLYYFSFLYRTLGFTFLQIQDWKGLFWQNLSPFLQNRTNYHQSQELILGKHMDSILRYFSNLLYFLIFSVLLWGFQRTKPNFWTNLSRRWIFATSFGLTRGNKEFGGWIYQWGENSESYVERCM